MYFICCSSSVFRSKSVFLCTRQMRQHTKMAAMMPITIYNNSNPNPPVLPFILLFLNHQGNPDGNLSDIALILCPVSQNMGGARVAALFQRYIQHILGHIAARL